MEAVKKHYERSELIKSIDDALKQHGLDGKQLTIDEVAAIDQFHIRGIEATRDIADSLQPTSDLTVLDIGCGLGGPARYFADKFRCHVTGIDLTQSYVDAATHLAELTGLTEFVKYDCGDALSLPYADESFDVAMTQHVAMNIQNRERFYSEAYRVLKNGGRLALYDIIAGEAGEVLFPVPWADSPATSFLLKEEVLEKVLTEQKFKILSRKEHTEEALDWVANASAKQSQAKANGPVLGLNVILGPGFGPRAANLAKNLREGRARVLEIIAVK